MYISGSLEPFEERMDLFSIHNDVISINSPSYNIAWSIIRNSFIAKKSWLITRPNTTMDP